MARKSVAEHMAEAARRQSAYERHWPRGEQRPLLDVHDRAAISSREAARSGTSHAHQQAAEAHRAAANDLRARGMSESNSSVKHATQQAEHHERVAAVARSTEATRAGRAEEYSQAAHSASERTRGDMGAAAHHEAAGAHRTAEAALRATGNHGQADHHKVKAEQHTQVAHDRSGGAHRAIVQAPHAPAQHAGPARAHGAGRAKAPTGPAQTGKKGGKFVISKSGKKRYV